MAGSCGPAAVQDGGAEHARGRKGGTRRGDARRDHRMLIERSCKLQDEIDRAPHEVCDVNLLANARIKLHLFPLVVLLSGIARSTLCFQK